jgi:hypothetical protein
MGLALKFAWDGLRCRYFSYFQIPGPKTQLCALPEVSFSTSRLKMKTTKEKAGKHRI